MPCNLEPARGRALAFDVSQPAAIVGSISTLDRLDVLVNCAGITGWTSVLEPAEGSIVDVSTVVAARGMRSTRRRAGAEGRAARPRSWQVVQPPPAAHA